MWRILACVFGHGKHTRTSCNSRFFSKNSSIKDILFWQEKPSSASTFHIFYIILQMFKYGSHTRAIPLSTMTVSRLQFTR